MTVEGLRSLSSPGHHLVTSHKQKSSSICFEERVLKTASTKEVLSVYQRSSLTLACLLKGLSKASSASARDQRLVLREKDSRSQSETLFWITSGISHLPQMLKKQFLTRRLPFSEVHGRVLRYSIQVLTLLPIDGRGG